LTGALRFDILMELKLL